MALIKCEECGESISSSAKVCPHCGIKINLQTCPECGAKLNGDEINCPECGYPVGKKSASNIITENLDKITGAQSKNYVKFKDLFKNTFKKHTEEDLDEVFVCGSDKTTPDVKDINPKNAGAWVYFKIFVFFIIAYIPTRIGFIEYGNANFLPLMIMLAAFAVPVTVLMFFFEINLFRNIPFYKVIKYFVLGGALSLILAILYFSLPYFETNATVQTYEGALLIGLVEEVAKAVIVAIFLFKSKKSILFYWIFAISYMLQIYFDFSGYSDIAIGLGRIFGFHFPENFDYPYTAKSITEFWRKWHMTLSSWFRDYVYIPLGGNRRGITIQIRNILIVWALTGLWHGSSWNFVLWGSLFGVILILEKFVFNKLIEKSPNIIKRIYTLFIVMISFVIFQSTDMSQIGVIIKGLFGLNNEALINATTLYYLKGYAVIIILGIIGSTPLLRNLVNKLSCNSKWNKIINILQPIYMILLLGIVTIFLVDNSFNPFLYFRF